MSVCAQKEALRAVLYFFMQLKLLLFDLDGTLIDTSRDIASALNHALKSLHIQELTLHATVSMIGEGVTRLVEKVLGERNMHLKDEVTQRFLSYYEQHLADSSTVYPFVKDTLPLLSPFRKAVISNKRESLSIELLEKTDLKRYFNLVVGSDTAPEKKPSPVPVRYALDRFGVRAHEAVLIGDSRYDIEAGKRAGVMTVGVTYGYGTLEQIEGADYLIDSFQGIPGILDIQSK
jgi:phosphoglycolate phosphatase